MFLQSNFKPRTDAHDKALWSRVINIPFAVQFVRGREPRGENERVADIHLDAALREEASGILAWLVEGCLIWQKAGLQVPLKVLREGEEYQSGEDDMGPLSSTAAFWTLP